MPRKARAWVEGVELIPEEDWLGEIESYSERITAHYLNGIPEGVLELAGIGVRYRGASYVYGIQVRVVPREGQIYAV